MGRQGRDSFVKRVDHLPQTFTLLRQIYAIGPPVVHRRINAERDHQFHPYAFLEGIVVDHDMPTPPFKFAKASRKVGGWLKDAKSAIAVRPPAAHQRKLNKVIIMRGDRADGAIICPCMGFEIRHREGR